MFAAPCLDSRIVRLVPGEQVDQGAARHEHLPQVALAIPLPCSNLRCGIGILPPQTDVYVPRRFSQMNWAAGPDRVHVHGSGVWGSRSRCDWFALVRRVAVTRGGHLAILRIA